MYCRHGNIWSCVKVLGHGISETGGFRVAVVGLRRKIMSERSHNRVWNALGLLD